MRSQSTLTATLSAALGILAATQVRAVPPPPINAPSAVLPLDGSRLPLNGRVVFFGQARDAVSFLRTDTQVELAFDEVVASTERNDLAFIVAPGELVAEQVVSIESRCGGCFQSQFVELTAQAEPDEQPPTFAPGPSTTQVDDGDDTFYIEGHEVSANLPPVTDNSGRVLVRFELEGAVEMRTVERDAAVSASVFVPAGEARTACFDITAIDVAGNETRFADSVCAELRGGGCTQTSSASSALPLCALFAPAIIRVLRGQRRRASRR